MGSSSDWEEIKRLASDLQRAQLSSSLQRLSERNCVEIINKLIELKLLDVYYTTDAKEYITPSHLSKEIKDELYYHGGRMSLSDLCDILNVDYSHIEKRATDLCRSESAIQLVTGQLITNQYLNLLAEEVNEKLQQNGSITIGDVAKHYDLPGNFLYQALTSRIGKIIHGQQDGFDPETFFTENYIARHKYQIRGVLTAITQPTPVSKILSTFHFQEQLFFSAAEKLISSGCLAGSFSGGRSAKLAYYTPNIYSQAQYDWTYNFLKQNGYLNFEALRRLGISDPQSYIKKHFKKESLTFVPGACIGQLFIDQIDANLEDAFISGTYVDISPFLPSDFSASVCTDLLKMAFKAREANLKASTGISSKKSSCQIFCDTMVVSESLLTKISLKLEELMPAKANEAIAKGAFKQQLAKGKAKLDDDDSKNKKEERRKKATGGKSGGGTQGRETKTKSTKKPKGKRAQQHDSDDSNDESSNVKTFEVEFLDMEALQEEIIKLTELEDAPEELIEEIALYFNEPINAKFQEVAKAAFLAAISGGGSTRKRSHQQLQEKVAAILTTIRLAEKGLKEFSDDLQLQLCKYLMRTQCSELVNELVLYLADESQIDVDTSKELTPETRLKVISKLNDDCKTPLIAIHKNLAGVSISQFLETIDESLAAADIILKKKDNKKDRQALLNHKTALLEQLGGSYNSAVSLHLVCLVLFQVITSHLLHASGKFVPHILAFLKPHIPHEIFENLQEFQGLVMKSLTLKKDEAEIATVNVRLEELHPKIKEIALTFKKSGRESTSISED